MEQREILKHVYKDEVCIYFKDMQFTSVEWSLSQRVSCEYRNESQDFLKSGYFFFSTPDNHLFLPNGCPPRNMEPNQAIHIRDVTLAFPHAHLFSIIARCLVQGRLQNYCCVCRRIQHCLQFRDRPPYLCQLFFFVEGIPLCYRIARQ